MPGSAFFWSPGSGETVNVKDLLPSLSNPNVELVTMKAFDERAKDNAKLDDLIVCGLSKHGTIKAVDGGKRTARIIISDSGPDRDKDIVDPRGWDFTDYNANPVVMFAHNYGALPVGRDLGVALEGAQVMGNAFFPDIQPIEIHPMLHAVYACIGAGLLNASSVGFKPIEWNYDEERQGFNILKASLYEYSIVPIPANPRALIVARSKGVNGVSIAPIFDWVEQMLDTAGFKAVPREDLETAYFIGRGLKSISVPKLALKGLDLELVAQALGAEAGVADATGKQLAVFEAKAAETSEDTSASGAAAGTGSDGGQTADGTNASTPAEAASEAAAAGDTGDGEKRTDGAAAAAQPSELEQLAAKILADPKAAGLLTQALAAAASKKVGATTPESAPETKTAPETKAEPPAGAILLSADQARELVEAAGARADALLKQQRDEIVQKLTGRMPD